VIDTQRISDKRGRTLIIERDIVEIRETPWGEHTIDGDPMDGPVVGRVLRYERATINGEDSNRRRVGQFIRRLRESMAAGSSGSPRG